MNVKVEMSVTAARRAEAHVQWHRLALPLRGDRCIGGVHGGSNKASKAIDNRRVIRTKQNLVTTQRGSIGRVGKRETATHELPAREYRVDPGSRSVAAAIF